MDERTNKFLSFAKEHKNFIPFLFSGGIAFLVTFSLLYVFTEFFKLWYVLSSALGYALGIIVNFTLQKFFVFRFEQKDKAHRQFILFFFVNLVSLGLNSFGMFFFVEKIGLYYLVAQIVVSGIIAVLSYFSYKLIVFKKAETYV